jgi:AraC-like DNA-binding protein
MLNPSLAIEAQSPATIVAAYRPFEHAEYETIAPPTFANDDQQRARELAKAIVGLLQEGNAAVTVPLPRSADDRLEAPTRSGGLAGFVDGDQIKFAVVAELKRDGETMALVFRLARPASETVAELPQPAKPGLPKWRLKRALAFIESNIGNPISLNDLAQAAGLSPVYFGAQFRLATGLPPHEYVLRRRICRAQQLLLEPNSAVLDVALSVGFQTQAHFSTVFKRIAGETPSRWRRQRMNGEAA